MLGISTADFRHSATSSTQPSLGAEDDDDEEEDSEYDSAEGLFESGPFSYSPASRALLNSLSFAFGDLKTAMTKTGGLIALNTLSSLWVIRRIGKCLLFRQFFLCLTIADFK